MARLCISIMSAHMHTRIHERANTRVHPRPHSQACSPLTNQKLHTPVDQEYLSKCNPQTNEQTDKSPHRNKQSSDLR